MSWLRVLTERIRGLFSKRRLERELDEELITDRSGEPISHRGWSGPSGAATAGAVWEPWPPPKRGTTNHSYWPETLASARVSLDSCDPTEDPA
jgi:hypothetical protein